MTTAHLSFDELLATTRTSADELDALAKQSRCLGLNLEICQDTMDLPDVSDFILEITGNEMQDTMRELERVDKELQAKTIETQTMKEAVLLRTKVATACSLKQATPVPLELIGLITSIM